MRTATLLPSTVAGAGVLAVTAVLLPPDGSLATIVPGLPTAGSRDLGLLALAMIGCCVVFVAWPWTVLPTAIVGVLASTAVLGDSSVPAVLGFHSFLLGAGGLSLMVRRLVRPETETRVRTVADVPMVMVVVVILAGAGYGLLAGHAPLDVLIAIYHFGVIPVYFFLATCTLTTPRRLRSAGVLFVVLAAVLTIASIAAPGRHGGAWSLLAAFPALVLSCRTRGWRRAGLVALAALFLVDLVLASYRTTWLLAAVAVLVLLVGGVGAVRRAAGGVVVATGLLLVAGLALSTGVQERYAEVAWAWQQGAGYRFPEAVVGLDAFLTNPLVGAGLGQSTPDVYLPNFAVTDVGPLYHVFYVMILANLGLAGMVVLLWPILTALRHGLAERDGLSFAFAALLCGFLASVLFSGPATGHWALGLLPALVLMTKRSALPAQVAKAAAPVGVR